MSSSLDQLPAWRAFVASFPPVIPVPCEYCGKLCDIPRDTYAKIVVLHAGVYCTTACGEAAEGVPFVTREAGA